MQIICLYLLMNLKNALICQHDIKQTLILGVLPEIYLADVKMSKGLFFDLISHDKGDDDENTAREVAL